MDDGHFFLPLPIDDHDFSYMAKLKKKKKKKTKKKKKKKPCWYRVGTSLFFPGQISPKRQMKN